MSRTERTEQSNAARSVLVASMLMFAVTIAAWSIVGSTVGNSTDVDDPAPEMIVDWAVYGADGEIVALAPSLVGAGRPVAAADVLVTVMLVLSALPTRKLRVWRRRPDPVIEVRSPFIGAPAGPRAPPFFVVV